MLRNFTSVVRKYVVMFIAIQSSMFIPQHLDFCIEPRSQINITPEKTAKISPNIETQ